jgi:hypothetical protein
MTSPIRKLSICAGFLLLVTAPSAWACSCAPIGSNPPCQATWDVSAVFTGMVTDIMGTRPIIAQPENGKSTAGRQRADAPIPTLTLPQRTVRLQIGEVLTGVERELKEIEVLTGFGGGDCGYGFEVGVSYIVYAYKNSDGQLSTGICSRTRPLKDADEDLAYMHAVPTAPATGEIRIVQARFNAQRISGVRINAEGNGKQYVASTNDAGEAKLSGLTAGEYKVHADLDNHFPVDRTVKLHAKGCVEVPIYMALDRRIQGRVLTKDGLPAAGVAVAVRPTQELSGDSVKTDADGRYELRHFESGGYYLGINLKESPTPAMPYTRWFYPGTDDPARAAVIYFSDEAEIKRYDLMLPDRQSPRVVEGTVVWPDRRPAAGALLLVMDPRWLWAGFAARATAGADGHFVLPLFDGTQYRLHATFINPPSGTASAEPVNIQAGKDPLNLRLVLTRPGNSVAEDQRKGNEQYRNKQY